MSRISARWKECASRLGVGFLWLAVGIGFLGVDGRGRYEAPAVVETAGMREQEPWSS